MAAPRRGGDGPPTAPGRAASGKRRTAAFALAALIGLALIGWIAARQIRSPAQIAADTAAPKPSAITVAVARRTLATKVIVRGTVRYGARRSVVLGTSRLEQGASGIVTRPPARHGRLRPGGVAMEVDGRPVWVLGGAVPMHRDLVPGATGPDVLQLEQGLAQLGLRPGGVDGRYDAGTQAAVSALYLHGGYAPFGATDQQLEQLRTAEAAAATARDAALQARNTAEQAARGATPAEIEQARIDAVTARDQLHTAELGIPTAELKLASARALAAGAAHVVDVAQATGARDQAQAQADLVGKQNAYAAAVAELRLAQLRSEEVPLEAAPSEREAAQAAVRQARDAVAQTDADVSAAQAAVAASAAEAGAAVGKAREDAAQAGRDARLAAAELRRARLAVPTARRQLRMARRRVELLIRPPDTRTLRAITASAAQEASRTRAEVARLSALAGVQVPANEIVFLPSLPVLVDAVKAKRGSTVSGAVMTVTSSQLAVDSSLSVADARLVHAGDPVTIEEQELNIKVPGRVSQVGASPGTHRVDADRFYLAVIPSTSVKALVGASVKLTVAVKSTRGAVLAVPSSALSVGGDGSSRVEVRRGGRTERVIVVPGLAADGLVEVRPPAGERLGPGDQVIVGATRGGLTP
jgi:multidrug efflux pump subunit AcrA (membrane-fusion protein)